MGNRLWRNQTGERALFWCTALILTYNDGNCFIPPVMVKQIICYTQDLRCNIPSDWVVHNSLSRYIDNDEWHKYMAHFYSMCLYSTLNTQVLLYDVLGNRFDDRVLNILTIHHIQYFILKSGDSFHDHPNDNGPNLKPENLYGNEIMNWMRNNGTLKFMVAHMNDSLDETWEAFKLSSTTITQETFKKTHILPLYLPEKGTNHQACLADTQSSNSQNFDEMEST